MVKINKDTHYQMDMAEAIQSYWEKEKDAIVRPADVKPEDYVPNKSKFDPRKWLIKGENKMQATVEEFCRVVGSANKSILL